MYIVISCLKIISEVEKVVKWTPYLQCFQVQRYPCSRFSNKIALYMLGIIAYMCVNCLFVIQFLCNVPVFVFMYTNVSEVNKRVCLLFFVLSQPSTSGNSSVFRAIKTAVILQPYYIKKEALYCRSWTKRNKITVVNGSLLPPLIGHENTK
jgi:hypothetical protein